MLHGGLKAFVATFFVFSDYDIDEALAMTKDISEYEFNISSMLSN